MKPGATAFEPVQREKAYPFGTKVECIGDSSAVILFTDSDAIRLMADSSAIITFDETSSSRVLSLERGTALTRIATGTAEDFVIIETPAGTVRSISDKCKISVTRKVSKKEPATTEVALSAEGQSKMKFIGHQFIIPVLKNGFGATISSTDDDSFTIITDNLGDYSVLINTGTEENPPEPFEGNPELNSLKLSSKAEIRLWREKAPISGTTIVAVLATTAGGKGRESFAFAVGKPDFAARSNVFIDTITNELAIAEAARANANDNDADANSDDAFNSSDFDDFNLDSGSSSELPASTESSDSEFDFLL